MLPTAEPQEIGYCPHKLQQACDLLETWTRQDQLPAAGLAVGRHGRLAAMQICGRQRPDPASAPLTSEAVFLVASVTKPVTCAGVMMLIDRGEILLSDRVSRFLPEFAAHGKEKVTLRHLMTHTSGLPDMLPDNDQLRAQHQGLAEFVRRTCELELRFPAGHEVSYQSMGIAILAEVVQRVSGQPCRDFLQQHLFEPLGMRDTVLGAPPSWYEGPEPKIGRMAHVRQTAEAEQTNWHWNTDYWWKFGAPWGGLLTTPADLSLFMQMMLNQGQLNGVRILSPAAVGAMTSNQLCQMPQVPELDRRCKPWGLGWRLNWPAHSENFGDLLSPSTYGHWGITGTVAWADPRHNSFLVLLTTQPQEPEGRLLAQISNLVASALR